MTLLPESAVMLEFAASYVAGKWAPATGAEGRLEVRSPASGDLLGTVGSAGDAEVDTAVAAARAALVSSPWRDASAADRAAALGRLADALTARKGVLADLTTAEIGSPRSWSTVGPGVTPRGGPPGPA